MKKIVFRIIGILVCALIVVMTSISCTHSVYSYEESDVLKIEYGNYKNGSITLDQVKLPSTVKFKIYNQDYRYKYVEDTFVDAKPYDFMVDALTNRGYTMQSSALEDVDSYCYLDSGLCVMLSKNAISCDNYFMFGENKYIPYLYSEYMETILGEDNTAKISYNNVTPEEIIKFYKLYASITQPTTGLYEIKYKDNVYNITLISYPTTGVLEVDYNYDSLANKKA